MTIQPDDRTEPRPPDETPTEHIDHAAAAQAHMLTPGTMLGGRYRVVSLIGRGGMGEVYRADDLRLGQPVALKFLSRRHRASEQLLFDEVRTGRQISHPNVCRLYDIAETDGADLHHHGVRRRRRPGVAAAARGPAPSGQGSERGRRSVRGACGGPRAERHPSRSETGQRHARRPRPRADHRLRLGGRGAS